MRLPIMPGRILVKSCLCLLLAATMTMIGVLPAFAGSEPEVTAIAASESAAYALKSDGTVWAWGDSGALGNNSTGNSSVPVQVYGLTDVTAVAGGLSATYALKADGTVWVWGIDDSTGYGEAPVQVSGLRGVKAIAAAGATASALEADGTVWAWGDNADSRVPVPLFGLTGVTAIAAGEVSLYALKADGSVWAWGSNHSGQLGNNSTTDSYVPVRVAGLSGVTAVVAGGSSAYALKTDGTVRAWGDNQHGELGDGSTTDSRVPVPVAGLKDVTAITTNGLSTYALKTDGTLWAWGDNGDGELANNSDQDIDVPVRVRGLTGVTAVAEGLSSVYVLKKDGTVWAWGDNRFGELGNQFPTFTDVPVEVAGLGGAASTPVFSDIAGSWAESDILSLSASGIVNGYPDGTFRPDSSVTRAEFIKMLVLAAKLPLTTDTGLLRPYTDYGSFQPWEPPYLATAVKAGLLKGFPDGTLRPDDPVNRIQMAAMTGRTLTGVSAVTLNFADAAAIPAWGREPLSLDVGKGILGGFPDNTFRPDLPATRAEVAGMLAAYLKH